MLPIAAIVLTVLGISAAVSAAVAYGSSVNITSANNQAQYGVSYDTTTSVLTASDAGFATTPASKSASPLACNWQNGGTCTQALTKGQFKYTVLLTINSPPASTTTYTVTAKWDQGSGQSTMGGNGLTVSVPSTVSRGETMKVVFSTAATSYNTPMGVDVTVS